MKKHKGLIAVGIIVLLLIIIVGYCISGYNSMVRGSVSIDESYSSIEIQLKRRADLIPNLVNTVKGYAAHEEELYTEISENRTKMVNAINSGSVEDSAAANEALSGSLSRLIAIAEAYPELKANENFLSLQEELAGTENRIAQERRKYNEAVSSYNQSIRTFPKNIIASMFNFEQREFFSDPENLEETPDVSF